MERQRRGCLAILFDRLLLVLLVLGLLGFAGYLVEKSRAEKDRQQRERPTIEQRMNQYRR